MSPAYNLHFAELQALGPIGNPRKMRDMGMKPKKIAAKSAGTSGPAGNGAKTWTQTPKGLPAVTGKTMAERARLVRYFVTHDDPAAFARMIGISVKTWNQFERGLRPISNPVMYKIDEKINQVDIYYLKYNIKKNLGHGFMDTLRAATIAAGIPPRKS